MWYERNRGQRAAIAMTASSGSGSMLLLLAMRVPPVILVVLAFFCVTCVGSTAFERPRYHTAYACEGSILNMECGRDHMINLIRANYGRFSITICNEHGNTEWSVNCMSPRSHRVLHDKCSQRQNCSIAASTRGFGDPCPGTLKYLEAHFQCLPVNPPSHTTRPRPPWAMSTKTTASSMVEAQSFSGNDSPFPRDIEGMQNSLTEESQGKRQSSTSTSTTLRPPPWLVTNATKQTTTTATTLATTTSASSTTTTTAPTTGAVKDAGAMASSGGTDDRIPLHKEAAAGVSASTPSIDHVVSPLPSSTTDVSGLEIPVESPGVTDVEEGTWCPPSSDRGVAWNWTKEGEVDVQPCPGGASGWATRRCTPHGWALYPNLGECRSVWLTTLMSRAEANDAVLAVSHDLTVVTRSRGLYGGDVIATAKLLDALTKKMAEDVSQFPDNAQLAAMVTELVMKAMSTGSNLLGNQAAAWSDLMPSDHREAVTALLQSLEEAAFFLAENLHEEKTVTHAVPNILMRLQVIDSRNIGVITFPSPRDSWTVPETTSVVRSLDPGLNDGDPPTSSSAVEGSSTRHIGDSITIPPEALYENADNGLVKVVFFTFEGLEKILQPHKANSQSNHQEGTNESRIVNSRVISASLGAGRHIELSEPIVATFSMIRHTNVSSPVCVFWDYTTSSWSEEGCRVLRYNVSHTICECDHLTNFAVLMDINSVPLLPSHEIALSIITYVGCVISIVCLLLATIIFHACKGLKNDRTTIHKNLCLCLLLGEAIFLGGITKTDQPLVCGIIAGLLHFFFLAAFAWMFLEGFQLYVMLVEVFEAEKSRVRWYYAAAYGFPALVVAVSALIDPSSYGTPDVCWLRTDNYFIFAFVGPVLLVLLANIVFLTLSFTLMCRHSNASSALKNKEHSRLASLRTWLRGAIVLMCLLGLTWTFGLLYLDQATVAMAYVFTVLNSLQGVFIFVFHCLQSDKLMSGITQRRWKRENSTSSVGPVSPMSMPGTLMRDPTSTMNNLGTLGMRSSITRASHSSTASRTGRHHANLRYPHPNTSYEYDDEMYSFKSCGRDSGHGGSEQEESPRAVPPAKLASLRINNNITASPGNDHSLHPVNPFSAAAALEQASHASSVIPDYRVTGEGSSLHMSANLIHSARSIHRNQPPWNHTYTEIPEGAVTRMREGMPDPVYEEIEREGRSEIQVSDLSDEDGRRQSSDISRQSSRSYGDHRPLLQYTLPDRNGMITLPHHDPRLQGHFRHQDGIHLTLADAHASVGGRIPHFDHTMVTSGHFVPLSHHGIATGHGFHPGNGHIEGITADLNHYNDGILSCSAHNPIVQPLSEPNLRSWEAVQRHRDLQHFQHLGEMTVAVLNGEQVVCKLKSPLAPIHENCQASSSAIVATTVPTITSSPNIAGVGLNGECYLNPPNYSHC